MTRIGLNGKPLTEKDIKKHKRLLRECGLPETLCDPVSQEELEKRHPHLRMAEEEKEVRRIVDEHKRVNIRTTKR